MLVEMGAAAVQAVVEVAVGEFITRNRRQMELNELKLHVAEVVAAEDATSDRLEAMEDLLIQLVSDLVARAPFDCARGTIEVRPGLGGASVQNAVDEFKSAALARMFVGDDTQVDSHPSSNDWQSRALSGFHAELQGLREEGDGDV